MPESTTKQPARRRARRDLEKGNRAASKGPSCRRTRARRKK